MNLRAISAEMIEQLMHMPQVSLEDFIKTTLADELSPILHRQLYGHPFHLDIHVSETLDRYGSEIRVYVSPVEHDRFREFGIVGSIDLTHERDIERSLSYLVNHIRHEIDSRVRSLHFFRRHSYNYNYSIDFVDDVYRFGWDWLTSATIREETEEEKQERSRKKEQTETAQKRALELLLSHCTEQQKRDYKQHQWFIVKGKRNKYRIRKASQINVDVLNKHNEVLYKLCTVPDRANCEIPIEDQLLAQKSLIELNEKEFLEIAKRWSA
jgi:hypothetical protein